MLVIDDSLLATNMYHVLFSGHPEWKVQYASDLSPLSRSRRRIKNGWDLIIVNTSVAPKDPESLTRIFEEAPSLKKVHKIFLISSGQGALKDDLGRLPAATLVQKPFFPYDLITEINRTLIHGTRKKTAQI